MSVLPARNSSFLELQFAQLRGFCYTARAFKRKGGCIKLRTVKWYNMRMKSWNEIRKAATAFSKRWKDAYDEKSQAQSFLKEFFAVFGVDTVTVATFEHRIKFLDGTPGYVGCFWQGKILVEMKSRGKDLDAAFRRGSNFVCSEVFNDHLILHLKLEPKTFPFEKGFSRDVSKIGHYGTGNVQLRLRSSADFEKAKPFLRQAYDAN